MAQATNTQVGEIQLAGDLAGNGGAQVGTNPQLSTIPGLVAGSYSIPNLTVDSKGRITEISNGSTDISSLVPPATASTAGLVSIGENIHMSGAGDGGFWTVNFGASFASGTATGLANQACAEYKLFVQVDGAEQTLTISGASAQTGSALIAALNAVIEGATVGIIGGNIVIASNSVGRASKVILTTPGLFSCVTGFVDIGSGETGNGSCEIYVKRGSTNEYGVVKIGAGINVEDGVISVDLADGAPATAATLGIVSVPASGNLLVSETGAISVPVASAATRGVVQVGAGLTVDGNGRISTDLTTLPAATTSVRGVVQVGAGLTVTPQGVLSIDQSTIVLPDATPAVKGVVRVGNNMTVSAGVIDVPVATGATLGVAQVGAGLTVSSGVVSVAPATASTLGAVRVGAGLSIDGSGILSATPIPDATTSTKGIVQIGSGLTVASGVVSAAVATASVPGVVTVGAGLTVASGVVSLAPATISTIGAVRVGSGLSIDGSGILSASAVPDATPSTKGIVQIGSGLTVASGVVSVATATESTPGVVQVGTGEGLTISSGVVSAVLANGSTAGLITNATGDLTLVGGELALNINAVRRNQQNVFTATQAVAPAIPSQVTSSIVTINGSLSNFFEWTQPNGSTSTNINFTSTGQSGIPYTFIIHTSAQQTAFNWPTSFRVKGYTAPSQSGVDVLTGVWVGSTFYGTYSAGYAA